MPFRPPDEVGKCVTGMEPLMTLGGDGAMVDSRLELVGVAGNWTLPLSRQTRTPGLQPSQISSVRDPAIRPSAHEARSRGTGTGCRNLG